MFTKPIKILGIDRFDISSDTPYIYSILYDDASSKFYSYDISSSIFKPKTIFSWAYGSDANFSHVFDKISRESAAHAISYIPMVDAYITDHDSGCCELFNTAVKIGRHSDSKTCIINMNTYNLLNISCFIKGDELEMQHLTTHLSLNHLPVMNTALRNVSLYLKCCRPEIYKKLKTEDLLMLSV